MAINKQHIQTGLAHLRAADPVMAELIPTIGLFRLKLDTDRFQMLARSILSQQISVAAARTIRERLQLAAGGTLSAGSLAALPPEAMRAAGLSRQKIAYLADLSAHVADGRLQLRSIHRKSDEEIISALIPIHGIGVWTAQMFLIFSLGRLDVFAPGDLGLRAAIRNQYGLAEMPTPKEASEIATPWKPYSTLACWYLWRSLNPGEMV